MANFRMDGIDEIIKELEQAGRFGEIAPKAVDAAAPVLEKAVKSAVAAAAGKGYAHGDLERSIKKTKAKLNEWGAFAVIKPTGKDHKGVSNAKKLLSLEFGNSRQRPHPCLAQAVSSVKNQCMEIMEETVYKELGRK